MNTQRKIEDEIKFKELTKTPIRLFGWVFVYFFIALLALGIFFGHKLIPISFNEQVVNASDSANVKKEVAEKKGGVTPAIDLNLVKTPTPEMIAKGKELFDANCKSCHGDNGMGDGPAGVALNPKPRNFHAVDGWTNGRTIDAMYKTLQEGIISRGMAAYEYLPPADRFDIIHYIRTFIEFPPVTENELTSLNASYNLTAGVVTPSTMPVSKSENIILTESLNSITKVQSAKQRLLQMIDNEGAKLIIQNSYNIEKVLWVFSSQQNLSFEKYLDMISNSSINIGYKPSVLQLSNTKLKLVYDVLNSLLS